MSRPAARSRSRRWDSQSIYRYLALFGLAELTKKYFYARVGNARFLRIGKA